MRSHIRRCFDTCETCPSCRMVLFCLFYHSNIKLMYCFAGKMSILGDGPDLPGKQNPAHPRGWTRNPQSTPRDPLRGPVSRYEVFAFFGPKQVHPRGWTGFGWKTSEGVHREGGRGEGKPSPGQGLTLRPRSTDFGTDFGWFRRALGMVWGYFRDDFGPTLKNRKFESSELKINP